MLIASANEVPQLPYKFPDSSTIKTTDGVKTPCDGACEAASGINPVATSASTSAMVVVKLCNGTEATFDSVLSDPTPYPLSDTDPEVTLSATGVVSDSSGLWRVVAVESNGSTVLHQVSPEHEESLIAAAVKQNPAVKLSFTRWVTLARKDAWPAEATAEELAIFGPHCCVSAAFVEHKQCQKRNRDAASRKRRAIAPPDTGTPPIQMSVTFTGTPEQIQAAVQKAAKCAFLQDSN